MRPSLEGALSPSVGGAGEGSASGLSGCLRIGGDISHRSIPPPSAVIRPRRCPLRQQRRNISFAIARNPSWSLVAPAALGVAAGVVAVGAATSPRRWFPASRQGEWLFVFPGLTSSGQPRWVVFVAYYAGMAVLGLAWVWLLRVLRRSGGTAVAVLLVFALWAVPFFVGPPLGSDDAIAYAASAKLIEKGFDPYEVGIVALGVRDPFVRAASPVWSTSPAPYGPLFLRTAQVAKSIGGSSLRATILVLRVACVLSLALLAFPLAALARRFDRPPSVVLAGFLCSPLVPVHLVGGVHNEALMLLPLVTGVAVGLAGVANGEPRRRLALVAAGVALCGVAASIKVPALFAAPVLGWLWLARGSVGRRLLAAAGAAVLGALVVVAVTVVTGLGFGWIDNLDVPQEVHTLLAPFTAVGTVVQAIVDGAGSAVDVVPPFRGAGTVVGLAVAAACIVAADRLGVPLALGGGLLVLALTAPVVWPWYFTWGLAFVVLRSVPRWLQIGVVVLNFSVTPLGPGTLDVNGYVTASAVVASTAWAAAAAVAVRSRASRERQPSLVKK